MPLFFAFSNFQIFPLPHDNKKQRCSGRIPLGHGAKREKEIETHPSIEKIAEVFSRETTRRTT
jgi:hypothetical protein